MALWVRAISSVRTLRIYGHAVVGLRASQAVPVPVPPHQHPQHPQHPLLTGVCFCRHGRVGGH
jgi:hypothetical protein